MMELGGREFSASAVSAAVLAFWVLLWPFFALKFSHVSAPLFSVVGDACQLLYA